MLRKSKKKVAFLEKPHVSPPPNQTPHPARAPERTARPNLPPKLTLSSSWPPAPPPGGRQLLEVNPPVIDSSCLAPGADPWERRFPWQPRNGAEGKSAAASTTTIAMATNAANTSGPTRPGPRLSHANADPSAVSPGPGPAQVRDLILLHREDSKKAKQEAEELRRKVLYLTGQYEDRVRDMEELLEAVQSEREEAERERQEVEQQNSELRSFNAELRSLIVRLQTCTALPPPRRAQSRAPPPAVAPPHPRSLWLRDRLATQGLVLDQLP
ncbi:YLP motif-containing protein 1-like isoform X2 [Anguilla anguilla]|uniref:YLP motif-containing protein 1-like isoform X2 n=1 Tax=Anguilla anguilla TaxID=7936 RepID=UPI0015AFE8FA|nr:YLP motif-containing protein 1-like isoform X2 [Anguilla anguilla]